MRSSHFTSSLTGVAGRFFRNPVLFISAHPDIILAILVVSMLGMMIVPLPTFLLDLFLTLNITFAMTLLISSLYIPDAISIASFPTLLLLTTLFRLSLNISSTRLILLNGYAGEVINSFGKFVVQGNYIVGGIIFLILTLIQFIVIAKGSERVAEVSARFNLDSMPGKQMSIDADLRTGAINMEDAKRLRRDLERENQFYGAMDGAMKFVKGDAIAGIVITAINIAGGLAIGVIQKGLSAESALKKYTILTIGDGLVSQIPSIVISLSAGIVVTRVASHEKDGNIGKEITTQITKYPVALMIVSILLIILSLLPGLPKLPFFLMGCATGLSGYSLLKNKKNNLEIKTTEKKRALPGILQPISIYVPVKCIQNREEFEKGLKYLQDECMLKHGIPLPDPSIIFENTPILTLKIYENTILSILIPENTILIPVSSDQLDNFKIPVELPFVLNGTELSFIKKEHCEILKNLGYPVFEDENILFFIIRETLNKNAEKFIGIHEVQGMLDSLSDVYPSLVGEVVPRVISLPQLSELLRRLVREGVPIRNLRLILESIARQNTEQKSIPELTELVRSDLKTEICESLCNPHRELRVHILSPFLESELMDLISGDGKDRALSLDPEFAQKIFESIGKICLNNGNGKEKIIIVTQSELRPFFRNFITRKFPSIIVISYDELDPEFSIHPVGEVAVTE